MFFGALCLYSIKLGQTLTRERAAKVSRKESEELYRELFHESMDLVFIMSRDGDFIDINPAGVRLLGFDSIEGLLKVNFDSRLVADQEALSRFYAEIDKYGFVKDYELALRKRDDAELLVAVNANAVLGAGGEIEAYRGVMRDVTDKRYLEQQVTHAQRMESIGKLAAGIAHQFNNVITAIQGYAELAAEDLPRGDKAADSLAQIAVAAKRAEHLTHELLVFSRKAMQNPKLQNINRLVEDALEVIGHIAGGKIVLSAMLYADPALAKVDAASMENALLNLILYSRSRLRGHGEIRVITGRTSIDSDDYVRMHPAARQGEFLTLTVEDNGPPMGPEDIQNVFEPFATISEDLGSGLEMSVVYRVVMNHDGWIDIESSLVVTRFNIYLPVAAAGEEDTVADEAPAAIGDFRGNGQKVLVVEDEDAVRAMAEVMLSNNGYTVFTARDANDAFMIFAREKGEIDAVFADLIMPGEDGISLADHLMEYNAGLPVILTSGQEATVDEWQSIEDHGYRFLPKPYRLAELLREVSSLFTRTGDSA